MIARNPHHSFWDDIEHPRQKPVEQLATQTPREQLIAKFVLILLLALAILLRSLF